MWSRALTIMLSSTIRSGSLSVTLPDGSVRTFGDASEPPVQVQIHQEAALRRLALDPEMALGECYMDGALTVEGDDIPGLVALAMRNMAVEGRPWWQEAQLRLRTALRRMMQNNLPGLSRRNVAHHYDLSADLYEMFLDADRQYSCAYFRAPDDTLEQAQAQKKEHIARKLRIEPGMRILDIGCGWGGMALTLARDHGARVLGVTLSTEQLAVARERARAEGLEDRVEFRLTDYRQVKGSFDRVVSVGMFEHVGLPHFPAYFRTVRERLAPDGIALIHTIGASAPPAATNPWMTRYIFPGGYIPSLSEISAAVERENLWIADVESLRLHYAMTLRHWRERFEANADAVARLYDDRFVRMWRFYLASCEQAFRHRRQCVFQFQLSRKIDAVPITRDYLYEKPFTKAVKAAAE